MILRRVIRHVRKQEWTAIVIDFVRSIAGQTAHYYIRDYAGVAAHPNSLSGSDPQWFDRDRVWMKSPKRKALIVRLRLPEYWRKRVFPPRGKPVGKEAITCG